LGREEKEREKKVAKSVLMKTNEVVMLSDGIPKSSNNKSNGEQQQQRNALCFCWPVT